MIEILLMEIEKPENLGSIARVMKNFGFNRLSLIGPKIQKTDEKAAIVSKHAKDILKKSKIIKKTGMKKYDYLIGTTAVLGTDYNIPRNSISPEQLAQMLSGINHKKSKIGILIGREGSGLTNEEIAGCNILVTIPSSRKYGTLNVSHALAIVLYELSKKISIENSLSHIAPASGKDLEVIEMYMDDILKNTEFTTEEKKDTQKKVWKRIFGKAFLSKREAFAVMGLLRKLAKK